MLENPYEFSPASTRDSEPLSDRTAEASAISEFWWFTASWTSFSFGLCMGLGHPGDPVPIGSQLLVAVSALTGLVGVFRISRRVMASLPMSIGKAMALFLLGSVGAVPMLVVVVELLAG